MNCQNVIQNNLYLPSQTAQIEVLLGRHWGKATSTERTQNGLRAYLECGDDLPLEGPRSPHASAQCVLVHLTSLCCFLRTFGKCSHCVHLPGNQTQAQRWKIEHSLNLPGCFCEAQGFKGANTAHHYPPVPCDVLPFAGSTTRDYRQW